MELSLLILVCIHKSHRLLGNICCSDRSWIFIFWSWKINVEKEEAPCFWALGREEMPVVTCKLGGRLRPPDHVYLPGYRTSLPFGQHQIVLLGNRGMCEINMPGVAVLGFKPRRFGCYNTTTPLYHII